MKYVPTSKLYQAFRDQESAVYLQIMQHLRSCTLLHMLVAAHPLLREGLGYRRPARQPNIYFKNLNGAGLSDYEGVAFLGVGNSLILRCILQPRSPKQGPHIAAHS